MFTPGAVIDTGARGKLSADHHLHESQGSRSVHTCARNALPRDLTGARTGQEAGKGKKLYDVNGAAGGHMEPKRYPSTGRDLFVEGLMYILNTDLSTFSSMKESRSVS